MKNIMTIGFEIPWHSDLKKTYNSNQSLLDADIIVFEPILDLYNYDSFYQGKKCYNDSASFKFKEDTNHWRKELSTALENGKTVFVFFHKYEDFFIYTGEKQYSGTGRNARTTNIVTSSNNYEFFPVELPLIIPKEGKTIKFINNPIFSTYWKEFRDYTKYESYFDKSIGQPLFLTKTGDKVIGAICTLGKGHLVILPPLRWDEKKFIHETKHSANWTPAARIFGENLLKILIEIDNSLLSNLEETPPPDWIDNPTFDLIKEKEVKTEIIKISNEIDNLTTKKNELTSKLDKEIKLKNLLYAKGKPLENAIIEALLLLGFAAEHYDDGNLEIDQIIESPENDRYIGEAEGKDTTAINVEKIRQLMANIQEDLSKDEIDKPAIGILFGNGYRLISPSERDEQFTSKCINTAKLQNLVLIRTCDLFIVSKYVKETGDKKFAKECRKAIKNSQGKIVSFPAIKK